MVRPEGTAIAPLGVANLSSIVADGDPAIPANRFPWLGVNFLEPRNDQRRLGLGGSAGHVIVRQRNIKRVLVRKKVRRNVIMAGPGIGIIISSITLLPMKIPGAAEIMHGIVSAGR